MSEERRSTDALSVKLDAIQENVSDMKRVLESLTNSVNRLGVIEERQSTGAAATERAFVELSKLDNRVNALEAVAREHKQTGFWVRSAVWASACAAVAYVAKKVGLI